MNSVIQAPGSATHRSLRRWLAWFVGLVILIVFAYVLYRERATLALVASIGVGNLVGLASLTTVSILITGLTTRLYLRVFDVRLTVLEAFWLAGANYLCGYLPMQLNLIVRAKYLKHLHSLNYASYAGMVIVNLIVMFQAIGIYGLLAVGWVSWRNQSWNVVLLWAFAACALVSCLSGRLIRKIARHWTDDQSRWARLLRGARALYDTKGCVPSATALTVCALFVYSLRFFCASYQLESADRFGLAAVLSPIATLSMYIAVTPSGLGVREFISAGMSQLLGMTPAIGFSVATVERAGSMVAIACWGLIGMVALSGRMRNVSGEQGKADDVRA